MPRRVSVKGRGADIFFGDYQPASSVPAPVPEADASSRRTVAAPSPKRRPHPPTAASSPPAEVHVPSPVSNSSHAMAPENAVSSGLNAPTLSSTQASLAASMQERLLASTLAESLESPLADVLDSIWDVLIEQATITNSFRYTDGELSSLTDVLYEIGKRHGVKITKQDVARLGLNAVLSDYRVHGDRSLLATLAKRRKRRPSRDA